MRTLLLVSALLLGLIGGAVAQSSFPTPGGSQVDGKIEMCLNGSGQAVPCSTAGVSPSSVSVTPYPSGAVPITGNAQGTTGAVVGTLAAAAGKTTYICGVHVDALGGTASVGPITIAGIVGSSMVFQGSSSAGGNAALPTQTFTPCIPASAPNTAITITTTADSTATAVDVNSWGFQL